MQNEILLPVASGRNARSPPTMTSGHATRLGGLHRYAGMGKGERHGLFQRLMMEE